MKFFGLGELLNKAFEYIKRPEVGQTNAGVASSNEKAALHAKIQDLTRQIKAVKKSIEEQPSERRTLKGRAQSKPQLEQKLKKLTDELAAAKLNEQNLVRARTEQKLAEKVGAKRIGHHDESEDKKSKRSREESPQIHVQAEEDHPGNVNDKELFFQFNEAVLKYTELSETGDKENALLANQEALRIIQIMNDTNVQDEKGNTLLHLACTANMPAVVTVLLAQGMDINVGNDSGQTAFDIAVKNGNNDIALTLLDKGAAINPTLDNLLFFITKHKSEKHIKEIVDQNSEVINSKNSEGHTALFLYMHSVKNIGKRELEFILFLLENGANPVIEGGRGESLGEDFLEQIVYKSKQKDIVDVVIDKLVDIGNHKITLKFTSFVFKELIENNQIDKIAKIINKNHNLKAALYEPFSNGNSAISILVKNNQPSLLNDLNVLDIDVRELKSNIDGDSLLHIAAKNGNLQIMEYLIGKGMSISEKNTYSETPIQCLLTDFFSAKFASSEKKQELVDELNVELSAALQELDKETQLLEIAERSGEGNLLPIKNKIEEAQNKVDVLEARLEDLKNDETKAKKYSLNPRDIERFVKKTFLIDADIDFRLNDDMDSTFNDEILDQLLASIQRNGNNPLELGLALNDTKISRKVAKKLGADQFKIYLEDIKNKDPDTAKLFEITLKYDLDNTHFGIKTKEMKPMDKEEREYYVGLLPEIFKSLMQEDEERFRRSFIVGDGDKTNIASNLEDRLRTFAERSLNNRQYRDMPPNDEERQKLYDKILTATGHTIKYLIEYEGEDAFAKKASVIGEYLSMVNECGPKVQEEIFRIYDDTVTQDSNVLLPSKSFEDEIYKLLIKKRDNVVRSITPRSLVSEHYIQPIRKRIAEYNVSLERTDDPHSVKRSKMEILDIKESFLKVYQASLFDTVRTALEDKDTHNKYKAWCEQYEITSAQLAPKSYHSAIEKIARGESIELDKVPENFKEHIISLLDEYGFSVDDLIDESLRNNILGSYCEKYDPDFEDNKISFILEKLRVLQPIDLFGSQQTMEDDE